MPRASYFIVDCGDALHFGYCTVKHKECMYPNRDDIFSSFEMVKIKHSHTNG